MRALRALKKRFLACSLLLGPLLAASEQQASLEGYLSGLKEEQFRLEQQRIDAQSSTLRDSWIQPIRLQYTYMKSDPYGSDQTAQNTTVVIDQPLFKSGGIYYAVKFADASHRNATDTLEQQRRALIKQTVSLLMQIRQSDLRQQRQQRVIENARINLEQKRELFLGGQLDSGFLDSAMIEDNTATLALYDIETALVKLKASFRALSDLDPDTAPLPTLSFVTEAQFLEANTELRRLQSQTLMQEYNSDVTFAKYLPQLNLVAGYNREVSEGVVYPFLATPLPETKEEYYNYGFKVSMPLDINSISDTEAARVSHLKSRVELQDKAREQRALYEQVRHNLDNYDRKIALAESNRELYSKILDETRLLHEAGYKTAADVRNLENSVAIQEFDRAIYGLDRQLELLELYEKLHGE